ncbi:TAXI family TRAP transporter solute-binding subunit [Franzmannia qiaohouensis]|uniref:TAXI family TRAP transporter solute-binding subunit n=1 Tax=Franzmannia qiaohouensis TaxID=1329370 RepID=A0ABU1HD21_9GAMM|nr:TAXI family TRAP transporter solute-binding subunit [Halomonas qiaohouensis]MDR5905246.1 TAXI family TRAP transporter solute-binding subunit [Halomonas qiaohouensis]
MHATLSLRRHLGTALMSAALVAATPALAGESLSIGVAPSASGWYFGYSEVSRIVSGATDHEISVRETGGSRENAIRLRGGEIDLALIDAIGAYEGYHGEGQQTDHHNPDMRVITWVAPSTMHWAVRQDRNIETFEDLEGERFNPSSIGGGGEYITDMVFEVLGIQPDFQRMRMDDAAEAVVDGRIVGFSYNGVPPIPAFTEVHSSRPLHILSFSDEQLEAVTEALPFLSPATIPAETYRDMPEATTLGTFIGIVANSSMGEETAYDLTRAYWENVEAIAESFAPVEGMTAQIALDNTTTPLHPGALRYYQEAGLEIPEAAMPPESQ